MSLRRVVSDRSLRREVDRVLVERQRFYEVARVPQPIAESVAEGRPSSTFSVAYSCSSSESDDEMDRETEKKEMAPVREKGDGFMKSVLKRFKGRRARSVDVGGTAVTKDSRRRSLAGCKETLKVGTDVKEDEMISKDEEKAGMGVLGDEVSADGTLSGDKTVVPSEEDVAIWAASDEKPFAPDAELLKSPSSPSGGLKARWSARWRTSFGALPRGGAATLSANLSSLSLDEVEAVEREEGLAAIDVAPAPKAVGSRFISMLKSRRRT
ncbi:hypothetical protein HK101_011711 [Irineochytrium annulatum]|nr:hypothetical protein HK101_011711 [Irineochytrium annulatum]